jgi:hypothetical protein
VGSKIAAESLGDEGDPEMVSSILDAERRPFDEFRIAVRNLAMVALVTRFHHWVSFMHDALVLCGNAELA